MTAGGDSAASSKASRTRDHHSTAHLYSPDCELALPAPRMSAAQHGQQHQQHHDYVATKRSVGNENQATCGHGRTARMHAAEPCAPAATARHPPWNFAVTAGCS